MSSYDKQKFLVNLSDLLLNWALYGPKLKGKDTTVQDIKDDFVQRIKDRFGDRIEVYWE